MSLSVRSGAVAAEDNVMYKISTDQAKDYLQKKFNMLYEVAKKKGKDFPDVKIIMYNQQLGKEFLPFILVLPIDVLENRTREENIPSVFMPDEDERSIRLNGIIYQLLSNYAFNKDDKRAFRSSEWKNRAGIYRRGDTIGTLLKYSTPKIENFGGAGKKVVMLIDPIRLFHDMLVDERATRQDFNVWIQSWNKIEDGSYEFSITRSVQKKKGESKNSFYSQMLRKINGGR